MKKEIERKERDNKLYFKFFLYNLIR